MTKFKVGDLVRKERSSYRVGDFGDVGKVYTVVDLMGFNGIRIEPDGPYCVAENFSLITEVEFREEEEWSDWEPKDYMNHSKYFKGCDFVRQHSKINGEYGHKSKIKLPKKPKRVAIKDLQGTVELDAEGKPMFDTYEE